MEEWGIELLIGIGKTFLLPSLYWGFLVIWISSLIRIREERESLGVRVFPLFSELNGTVGFGLLSGLILSVFLIGFSISLPFEVFLIYSLVMILFSATIRFTWTSPAYTLGVTYLLVLLVLGMEWNWIPSSIYSAFDHTSLPALAILIALLLFVEAFFILRQADAPTFPMIRKGHRGKPIGQQKFKKGIFVPFLLLIPGVGGVEALVPWWPTFDINGESFGFLLVPFFFGVEHVFQGFHPTIGKRMLGRYLFILSLVILAISIVSIWIPIASLFAVLVGIIGREICSLVVRMKDQAKNPYFSIQPDGLYIVGVIQGSPADQMGLRIGERIEKVNNRPVASEKDFYNALQANGAYTKLEVRGESGEIRFAQRATYEGEHHELGLIFLKEEENWEDYNEK
ncbi:PDZ domain-containing protein [Bacillaceae bacterium S4-13-58]